MPTIDMTKTGENIKRMRKTANVTVEDIANAAGVSERAVFKWQAGKAIPTIDNLIVLSVVFKTTIDNIVAVTK